MILMLVLKNTEQQIQMGGSYSKWSDSININKFIERDQERNQGSMTMYHRFYQMTTQPTLLLIMQAIRIMEMFSVRRIEGLRFQFPQSLYRKGYIEVFLNTILIPLHTRLKSIVTRSNISHFHFIQQHQIGVTRMALGDSIKQ